MTRTKTLSAVFAAVLVVLAGGAAITLAANSGTSGTNAAMQDETTTVGVNETTVADANETTVVDANETTVGVTETTAAVEETTTARAEETTDGAELQSFNVSGLNAPNTAAVGDTITVSANVTNPNEQEDTQPVEFRLDGDVVDRQNVTLGANETQNVTFEVDTTDLAPGLHIHGILTEDFGQLDQITLLREPMTTTPGDNETTTEVVDNETTTEEVVNETTTEEPVETTTEEMVNETTTEEVVNETTTEAVVNETTTEEPVETTTEEPVETTTEEPVDETTTEAPEERVEQLVFKVEQVQIDEWSFIIGDSETPDRTEVIEGVNISDRTQRINLTQLMMEDGSVEDAMGNETGDDYGTITTPSAEDRELPSDLETVRVVIRDVTIENVTFIVEIPPEAELPEMPETITPEEPEETTEVVDTETEEPVETTEEDAETTAVVNETTTEVVEETTVAVNETTVAVNETTEPAVETTAEEETTVEEGTTTTEDGVETTDEGAVGMTTTAGELQSFTVDNLTAPETVNIGDTLMVSANVTNPADEESTQRVEFRIDGDLIDRQNVTLDAGETQNVTFEVDTTGAEPGIYVHGVLTDQFGELGLVTLQEGVDGAEETTVEETTEEETTEAIETTEAVETTVEEDGNVTDVAGETTTAADETTDEEGITTDEFDGNETAETTTEEV